MFVFLSKFLPLFVYPIGITCVLITAALIIRKKQKLNISLILLAFLVLFFGGNRYMSMALAKSLEWRYLPLENIPQADAIVILGGGTEPGDFPRPEIGVNAAGDRVLYAARLFKEGKSGKLLLSGGNIDWMDSSSSTPASQMEYILLLIGIPKESIWLQPRSQNTYEDALYSSQMLKENGISRVILVTSAMHMPRAVALFVHQGIEVIPAPTDYTVTEKGWYGLFHQDLQGWIISLIPNSSSIGLTTNVLKEYIGMLVYHWKGWL